MSKARMDALLRVLLDSGDITPMGVRMIKKVLDEDGGDA